MLGGAMNVVRRTVHWLNSWFPSWSSLRKLGESKALKSSYLWFVFVPIAARLFEKIDDIFPLTIAGHTFTVHASLPFSWITFYLSACAFTIASLIYSWRCPTILQDFSTYEDFKKSGRGISYLDNIAEKLPSFALAEIMKEDADSVRHLPKTGRKLGFDWKPTLRDESDNQRIFWLIWDANNRASASQRLLAFYMYLIGFIFLGKVVLQNFVFVVNKMGLHLPPYK
jgi:hypothetical protein